MAIQPTQDLSLRTRMLALGRSAGIIGLANISTRAAVFFLYAAITARLPLDQAAFLVNLIAFTSGYAALTHYASSLYVAKQILAGGDNVRQVNSAVSAAFGTMIVGSALVATIFMGTSEDPVHTPLGGLLAIFCVAWLLSLSAGVVDFTNSTSFGAGRFISGALTQLILAICVVGAIGVTYLAPDWSLAACAVAFTLPALYACLSFTSENHWRFRWSGADLSPLIRFSTPLVLSNVMITPLTLYIVGTIPGFTTADRLAFILGLNWLGIVMAIPGVVSTASLSLLSRAGLDRKRLAVAVMGVNIAIAASVTLAIFALLPLLTTIYGAQSASVSDISAIVIFCAIPFIIFQAISNAAVLNGTTRLILIGNIIFAAVLIATWLGSQYRPISPSLLAWALLASYVARSAVSGLLLRVAEHKQRGSAVR